MRVGGSADLELTSLRHAGHERRFPHRRRQARHGYQRKGVGVGKFYRGQGVIDVERIGGAARGHDECRIDGETGQRATDLIGQFLQIQGGERVGWEQGVDFCVQASAPRTKALGRTGPGAAACHSEVSQQRAQRPLASRDWLAVQRILRTAATESVDGAVEPEPSRIADVVGQVFPCVLHRHGSWQWRCQGKLGHGVEAAHRRRVDPCER